MKTLYIYLALCLVITQNSYAQIWTQTYNGIGEVIDQTADGGFMIGGGSTIRKVDQHGLTQWSRNLGPNQYLTDFTPMSNGNYGFASHLTNSLHRTFPASSIGDPIIGIFDPNGNVIATNTISLPPNLGGSSAPGSTGTYYLDEYYSNSFTYHSVVESPSGGVIAQGNYTYISHGWDDALPMSDLDIFWEPLPSTIERHGNNNVTIHNSASSGFAVETSSINPFLTGFGGTKSTCTIKDSSGNMITLYAQASSATYENFYLRKASTLTHTPTITSQTSSITNNSGLYPTHMSLTADQGVLVTAVSSNGTVYLSKFNASLVEEWTQTLHSVGGLARENLVFTPAYNFMNNILPEETLNIRYKDAVTPTNDGGAIVASVNNTKNSIVLTKLNATGQILWTKSRLVSNSNKILIRDIKELADSNVIVLVNNTNTNLNQLINTSIYKFDQNATVANYTLSGKVFYDANSSCSYQSGEALLKDIVVQATHINTGSIALGASDINGNYELFVDSGDYTISIVSPYYYHQLNCTLPTIVSNNSNSTLDIPLENNINCPFLQVEVGTPFLRRCFPNTYNLTYSNLSAVDAPNTQIWVELDPFLVLDSTSVPIAQQQGDSILFHLDTVRAGQGGRIQIHATVSCNSALGQAHCVRAHITPDTICIIPPNWNGADIHVQATCGTDSVRFRIENKGNAMSLPLNYTAIEDTTVFMANTFQLAANTSLYLAFPTTGATYRVEAEQPANHPWSTTTAAAVEGCTNSGSSSTGFLTQYFEDDASPFIAIDCQQNIGSYDPNDKQGYPIGYGTQHFIEQNQDLEYKIRFQNTGTDTAFTVMILDTISPLLDISTIQMGASSHDYIWNIENNNTLKIVYNNIELPDSNINEPASHGFVKFKIKQQNNVPLGNVINNSAAIYFDFNPPIITNTTVHTLGDNFMDVQIVMTNNTSLEDKIAVEVKVSPNPFVDHTIIEIMEPQLLPTNTQFIVYNSLGQVVKQMETNGNNQFRLERNGLNTGIYHFAIQTTTGKLLHTGQLIVQ
jgi:hypothetical protein